MDTKTATLALYDRYRNELQEIADLKFATALLQWDQETYMPPGGAAARARQVATLTELAHIKFTAPSFGDLLTELLTRAEQLSPEELANIQLSHYDYQQQTRLPVRFVRELSETVSSSFNLWLEARKSNSFSTFAPILGKLVDLKRQEADLLGYEQHPYNALLNQYERGCDVAVLDDLFRKLTPSLGTLIRQIHSANQVSDNLLHQAFPEAAQWEFGLDLIQRMGYNLNNGRQDKAAHPFTIHFGSKDVRITSRVQEDDISYMTWSTIHELGHALYEQGLPDEQYGLPLGEATSLGIHESQSRLWENNIARSKEWCEYAFPIMSSFFPEQCRNFTPLDLFKAVNKVQPSLIRTEADELTYHYHIMIRYEIEKTLLDGRLKASEIPERWNQLYKEHLDVDVPSDTDGCLQDVHWSHGSFGYFPTYSLGSIYAAQLNKAMGKTFPHLSDTIRGGDFKSIINWLSTNIYIHGRRYTSEEICRRVTGRGIDPADFMQYATDKYRLIYAF